MAHPLIQDIRSNFRGGTTLTRLMMTLVAVFVVVIMSKIILNGIGAGYYEQYIDYITLDSDLGRLPYQIWTLLSYALIHESFWHLAFNLIALYWFGGIFEDLLGSKRLLAIFILGAILGAIFFLIFFNIPTYRLADVRGASAGIMAIMGALAYKVPYYNIRLMFLGDVKLVYILIFYVLLDITAIAEAENAGGSMSHLGGLFLGIGYMWLLTEKGINILGIIENGLSFQRKARKRKFEKVLHRTNTQHSAKPSVQIETRIIAFHNLTNEERVDKILEKITDSGIESLSDEELAILKNNSRT